MKTVSTDSSLEEIYCKREERSGTVAGKKSRVQKNYFLNLIREITAHGVKIGMMNWRRN